MSWIVSRGIIQKRVLPRPVRIEDLDGVHSLIAQLGYCVEKDEIAERISRLDDRRLVLVVSSEGAVIGFISAVVDETFVEGRNAHVEGFAVDHRVRGLGFGRVLLHAAEAWAVERACANITVHSNVVREQAHHFYRRRGYGLVKSQCFFRKMLSSSHVHPDR